MVRGRTVDVTRRDAGFALTELLVVLAMLGILAVVAGPQFLSYWRTAATQSAAAELATAVNRARQLAISGNVSYCAKAAGGKVQYRVNSNATCSADAGAWTGPGTDGSGFVSLSNRMTVAGGPVVFSSLGAATLAGTFTVTNPNGGTRNVVVAASGRVTVQ